jgi:hypothetical protein
MASRTPKSPEGTTQLGVHVRPSLKAELAKLAAADRRSLSSYIQLVLEAHVEAKKKEGRKR